MDPANEQTDLLIVILRSPDPPSLSRPQFQRVFRASRAYKAYKTAQAELDDSDDDLGPEDEEAWLFEDLNILLRLWMRRREKELLVALIFEVSLIESRGAGLVGLAEVRERSLGLVLIRSGCHSGAVEGHHHDLLHTLGPSL